MTRISSLSAAVFLSLALTAPARAELAADFTLTVGGLTAGTLTIKANQNNSRYAVAARTASAGAGGIFKPFTNNTKVSGSISQGKLRPARYVSQNKGGRIGRTAELEFVADTPRVVVAEIRDHEEPYVHIGGLKGVVDPLTGLYAVLRDTTKANACKIDMTLFDGHRVTRVTLSKPQQTTRGIQCTGVYRRISGYPKSDLAERREFPFTLLYAGEGNVLRAQEMTMRSLFGPARMIRN